MDDIKIEEENDADVPEKKLKKIKEQLKKCLKEKDEYLAGVAKGKSGFYKRQKG